MCSEPIRIAPLNAGHGSEVEASLQALHGFRDDPGFRDVSPNKFYAWRLIGEFARRKVIDDPHAVTTHAQGVH
jgi:hypothetical protein